MQLKKRIVSLFLVLAALLAGAVLAACGGTDDETSADQEGAAVTQSTEGGVSIADPWSRQPVVGQTTAAAYGVVSNNTDVDVQILGVSSPVSDNLELHQTTVDDEGVMSMSQVFGGFTVPAGGSFTFEPGGPHIMIFDIDAVSYPSDMVTFTLELDSGDELTFEAEVRGVAGAGNMDHGDMDSGDVDEMDSDS